MQTRDAKKTLRSLLAVAACAAGSAQAGQTSYLGVGATVVHSMRLDVAAATSSAQGKTVRAVRLASGTFYVVNLDVGVNGAAAPTALGLHIREGSAQGAQVRYHQGRDGSWSREGFGVAIPGQQQGMLELRARESGGEVGVFVPGKAPSQDVNLVVTVMADAPSASPTAGWGSKGATTAARMLASR